MLKAFWKSTWGSPEAAQLWSLPLQRRGDGQNRNSLIKMVMDPQRLPYRERWKSLGSFI